MTWSIIPLSTSLNGKVFIGFKIQEIDRDMEVRKMEIPDNLKFFICVVIAFIVVVAVIPLYCWTY